MKYICTEDENGDQEIFTFPRSVNHDSFAESVERIRNQTTGNWMRMTRTPISAGFVGYEGTCFGRSETLRLDSREELDTLLLSEQYK